MKARAKHNFTRKAVLLGVKTMCVRQDVFVEHEAPSTAPILSHQAPDHVEGRLSRVMDEYSMIRLVAAPVVTFGAGPHLVRCYLVLLVNCLRAAPAARRTDTITTEAGSEVAQLLWHDVVHQIDISSPHSVGAIGQPRESLPYRCICRGRDQVIGCFAIERAEGIRRLAWLDAAQVGDILGPLAAQYAPQLNRRWQHEIFVGTVRWASPACDALFAHVESLAESQTQAGEAVSTFTTHGGLLKKALQGSHALEDRRLA
mmetsp:Transcript_30536/g.88782  ORF Transcript_30536/g.88782 Transcript_30536/m.88782 type:complete len:258 (+) Transcript_30536:987-1760(+)